MSFRHDFIIAACIVSSFFAGYYTRDYQKIAGDRQSETVEVERQPFHGSFACEFYGAKTQQVDDVVDYDVWDLGNNLGWRLTLADGAMLMYIQSADKHCYVVANKPTPSN